MVRKSTAKGNDDDNDGGVDDEAKTSYESRGKESRGCTHSEVSAGLRIKTRGEFESGKVLNDFRRSCLASWFIRKSQFAQRAERTNEIDKEKERERERGAML